VKESSGLLSPVQTGTEQLQTLPNSYSIHHSPLIPRSPSPLFSTRLMSSLSSASSPRAIVQYWPLCVVTVASIFVLIKFPFAAPGLFLIQYRLLHVIRLKMEKSAADASIAADKKEIIELMNNKEEIKTLLSDTNKLDDNLSSSVQLSLSSVKLDSPSEGKSLLLESQSASLPVTTLRRVTSLNITSAGGNMMSNSSCAALHCSTSCNTLSSLSIQYSPKETPRNLISPKELATLTYDSLTQSPLIIDHHNIEGPLLISVVS
jgi:hypothetical protein